MQPKLLVFVALFFGFLFSLPISSADIAVGVKAGDWIEYNVSYTGAPDQGHNVVWARMEIVKVSGPIIDINITSELDDNSTIVSNSTLNLQTGDLIDDFIIPANLTLGQTFIDKNLGKVTIENVQNHVYAGAARTVVSTSTATNTYIWDQASGVSLEGNAIQPNYTMHTIVGATNIWQSATPAITGAINILFVAIPIILATTILVVALVITRKKHSKPV